MQIGINTGEVLATVVGRGGGRQYTVMGTAVNVGARLEKIAPPGRVVVSQSTYRLVAPLFRWEPLGDFELRGLAQPLPVYAVAGVNTGVLTTRGLRGLAAPLVGRDEELARLREGLAALQAGRGRIVALIGEAGLGKSRLSAEARRLAGDVQWYAGYARAYGQAPFEPALTLLRAMCGVGPDESGAALAAALRVLAHRLGLGAAEASIPTLMSLVEAPGAQGTPEPDRALALQPVVSVDVSGQQHQVLVEFTLLASLLAATRPLVLVWDDIHWADATTLALLEQLGELVSRTPLLMIWLFRPDRSAPSWALHERARTRWPAHYQELALAPLTPPDSTQLIDTLLVAERAGSELDDLRAVVLAKAEGNPFFLEELLRELIDAGLLYRDSQSGTWRVGRPVHALEVPATLRGVIAARVDRLPEEMRLVLQLGAVVGREFPLPLLEALVAAEPGAAANLPAHLEALQQGGLIEERQAHNEAHNGGAPPGTAHEPGYRFYHSLTQETVYQELSLRRRRQLHRRTAGCLEQLYGTHLGEHVVELAYHYEQANAPTQAVDYLLRAAEQSCAVYAQREALDYFERALALAEQEPGRRSPEWLARVHIRRAYLCLQLQELPRAFAEAERALACADPALQAEALWLMANASFQRDLEQGWRSLERGIALASQVGDRRILARCLAWYGCLGVWGGRLARREDGQAYLREAAALATAQGDAAFWLDCYDAFKDIGSPAEEGAAYSRALEFARDGNDQRSVVALLAFQADLCSRVGEHAAAVSNADLAAALGLEDVPTRAFCWRALGWSLYNLDRGDEALGYLRDALALYQQLGQLSRIAGAYLRLCLVQQALGEPLDRSLAQAREWLAAARAIGEPSEEVFAVANLAWLTWQSGDLSQALALMRSVDSYLGGAVPWWYEAGIRELLAEVQLSLGDWMGALAAADRLEALARRESVRELTVRASLLRARALAGAGQYPEARLARARGLTLASEMGQVRLLRKLEEVGV